MSEDNSVAEVDVRGTWTPIDLATALRLAHTRFMRCSECEEGSVRIVLGRTARKRTWNITSVTRAVRAGIVSMVSRDRTIVR